MQLDLWSDVVCPWCWLGHTRLRAALEQLGIGDHVDIRWRAFQLDPGASTEPGELRPALEAKYGPGAFDSMSRRLTALGADAGIEYRFDIAQRVNTADAHRLLQVVQARHPDHVDDLGERLFRAYFSEGLDVADHATLVRCALDVGLDADEVTEVLASGAGAEILAADRAESREVGITGVPAVVFNGAVVIPGAQDTDTMALVLGRLHAKHGG